MAFTWQSAGHAFASLFKDVVTVSKKVVTALGGLQNEEKLIESLTSLVSPQAAAVEQIAFGALGELVAAVQATETAAGANGVNVSFDASVFAEVKKLITDFPSRRPGRGGVRQKQIIIHWCCGPSDLVPDPRLCCCSFRDVPRISLSAPASSPILRFLKPKTSWQRWPTRCPCGTPMLSRGTSGWRSQPSKPILRWHSRKRRKTHSSNT